MITINSDYANYIDNGSIGMENIRTEDIFVVDTSSRAIIVPESWTAVGALQDHFAEKIWFSVDRFFDDKDFATAQKFMINFLNAANEGFAHNSTEVYLWNPLTNALLDITSGYTPDPTDYETYTKILFCWKISQNVTIRTGKVTFAIRLGAFTFGDEEGGADNQWIWSSGLATLNVIETVSAENGLDDDNNEWSVSDLSRWFESLAKIGNGFNTYLDVIDTDYKVFYGPANGGEQKYIKYDSSSQMLTTATTAYSQYAGEGSTTGPYRDLENSFYRIDNRGFISTATRDVKYGLWINSDETSGNGTIVPEVTTVVDSTSTSDTFSAGYITNKFNAVANTYLTKTNAANTYLTKTSASNTLLSKTDAASTYLSKTDAAATYETSAHAASSYLGTAAIVDSNASTATNSTWSSKAIKDAIDNGGGNVNEQVLTLSQYENLSEAEKMDGTTYYISDANATDSVQPLIYSDDEREIGVWRNGKPLYQKTIYLSTVTTGNNTILYSDYNITNVEDIMNVHGFFTRITSGNVELKVTVPNSAISGGYNVEVGDVKTDTFNLAIGSGWSDYTLKDCYLTLQYTKSADTPYSGIWTPDGVPAVHYSTSEKVVGTWIDGRPVYEVTLTVATTTHLNNVSWTAIPFSETEPTGVDFIIDAVTTTNPPTNSQFRFKYENGHFCGASIDTDSVGQGSYCIFRYVKTAS